MKRTVALAALATICASPSVAEGWSGGLGFTYALPTESEDRSITEYFGGLEYAFNRNFSLAFDLAAYDFEDFDDAFISSTWHLIYHVNESASVGFFAGADILGDDSGIDILTDYSTATGLEVGVEYAAFEGEGYLGVTIPDGELEENGTIFGVSGEYDILNNWSAIGSFDYLSVEDLSANVFAIGVEYEFDGGPELFAKVGQRSGSVDDFEDDSQFVEIGASVSFGRDRGTTFERRSVFEALPNF